MGTIRFFNTLTREEQPFQSIRADEVRLYTCGPTVYSNAHIGNFRAYVFEDLLRRWLRYRGYQVLQVMNITDVEDKIIAEAMRRGVGISEVTEPYEKAFFEDLDALGIERAEHYPRATDHIPEMLELIKQLEDKGLTYESGGSVYYRIDGFSDYGKLAHLDVEGMKDGARIDSDEYEKESVRDFALWKAPKPGEPVWESAWGNGRPGWHIECSAMSMKYLGNHFDIHTGGVDNIFPHHENEIAQSVGATGEPFVNYWLHCAHLRVEGEKMSKSLGNQYTLRDLTDRGLSAKTVRYVLASVHYRKSLNFTEDATRQAEEAIRRLEDARLMLRRDPLPEGSSPDIRDRISRAQSRFEQAMDADLNAAGALGAVFSLIRELNTARDKGELLKDDAEPALEFLARFDSIFGVLGAETEDQMDAEIEALVQKRQDARKSKDFGLADEIRDQLREMGVVLEDTREGIRWKKENS